MAIITARPKHRHKNVESETIAWLSCHRIPYDLLIFDRDKAEAISEHVLPANVIAVIEDRRKHAVEIAALGLPVLLFPSAIDPLLCAMIPGAENITPVTNWREADRRLHELILKRCSTGEGDG